MGAWRPGPAPPLRLAPLLRAPHSSPPLAGWPLASLPITSHPLTALLGRPGASPPVHLPLLLPLAGPVRAALALGFQCSLRVLPGWRLGKREPLAVSIRC